MLECVSGCDGVCYDQHMCTSVYMYVYVRWYIYYVVLFDYDLFMAYGIPEIFQQTVLDCTLHFAHYLVNTHTVNNSEITYT